MTHGVILPLPAPPACATGSPAFDLLRCVHALDGWVAPDGLAPRAAFESLVAAGQLEAWAGRPLYRAPRRGEP